MKKAVTRLMGSLLAMVAAVAIFYAPDRLAAESPGILMSCNMVYCCGVASCSECDCGGIGDCDCYPNGACGGGMLINCTPA